MQYLYENRYFKNQASVALNPLVSLFGCLVARSTRISGTGQTDGRTDGQNDRPSTVTLAAYARRGLIMYTNVLGDQRGITVYNTGLPGSTA